MRSRVRFSFIDAVAVAVLVASTVTVVALVRSF